MTVRELTDAIIEKTGVVLPAGNKDRLIAGSFDAEITGIATTFMATASVIRRAAAQGINCIITHEPVFFSDADHVEALAGDSVYHAKHALIEETGMNIWRFHDHPHAMREDLIYEGMAAQMGWKPYAKDGRKMFFEVPGCTVREAAQHLKQAFSMPVIRVIGKLDAVCHKAGLLLGAFSLGIGFPGGELFPIQLMRAEGLDLLIFGEILEWTSPAYVRDAAELGIGRAIIQLGHNRSEEAGMERLLPWLAPLCDELPLTFIEAGEPFTYV